jgi:membrane carboxypeptidase/penicillin-binding protein PbpC
VITNPANGQVLALVGDTSLAGGEKSLARHPIGTLQTPFVALAGFARSLGPASLVWDIPADSAVQPDRIYHGPVRLRTALVNDYLAGMASVLEQVGSPAVTATARSLGLADYRLAVASQAALEGGAALDPLDLAQAFGVFSTLGALAGTPVNAAWEPQLILSVQDAVGTDAFTPETGETRAAVSPQLAYLVHHVLASSTRAASSPLALDRPAGVKTGQADGGSSTWTAGYTRQRTLVIWLGYAGGNPAGLPLTPDFSAGIWHAVMQFASSGQPVEDWTAPAGVAFMDVCDPSGLLPTTECPNVVREVFLEQNLPAAADNLYQQFTINRETGRLATIFTPLDLTEEKVYLVLPPEAQKWSQLANLPVPPAEYDNIPPAAVYSDTQLTRPRQFSAVHGKVRLYGTAAGDDFVSYRLDAGQGINPGSWLNISETTSSVPADGLLGEWDTSGLNGLFVVRLMTIHTGQRIELTYLQVTVDNTPPEVGIPYPLPGQVFAGSDQHTLTLQASAQDGVGVARVEWWVDGREVDYRTSPPFAIIWDGIPGKHTLQVRVFDRAGNETRSDEIEFTLQ